MPSVTLIYDVDCPGADAARDNLRVALHEAGLPVSWREVCRSVDAPVTDGAHVGSPTVLVNGTDVAPGPSPTGRSCRTYVDDDGVRSRVPSAARISASLKAALSASLKASFKAALQAL